MNELTETTMAAATDDPQGRGSIDRAHADICASTARKTHRGKRWRPPRSLAHETDVAAGSTAGP
ncbi:hypothetical protein [Bradyrhizobium sp. BR 1433]|uniref:hypothetical protein n=1 Tax=Bradyrhizobium sp. BR 1433 TaxID=3447967 RepID=UPI003EE42D47